MIISKPQYEYNSRETGMEHVQNLLSYATNFGIYNSTANDSTISYFENLSDFLRDQEEEFYAALGVNGIGGLNQLLFQIGNTHNLTALDAGGIVFQEIKNRYVFKDKSKTDEQKEQRQEQDIFALITQLLSTVDADKFTERYMVGWTRESEYIFNGFTDALAEALNGLQISNGTITYLFTAYGKGTSSLTGFYSKKEIANTKMIINLNKLVNKKNPQGKITIEDNRFKIEGNSQALAEAVQIELRDRIRPALEQYLNVSYQSKRLLENMPTEQIRTEVLEIIKEKGVKLDSDDIEAAQKIQIGRGSGNISGFLGELQSRLYFKALFSEIKDAEIIDQGASLIKSLGGSGQMDPTDTKVKILNKIFNMQVKNYAKGGAEWSGNSDKKTVQTLQGEKKVTGWSGARSFVLNRLQISDSNLINFLGAATWHNLNPAYAGDPKYGEYAGLYSNFQKIFASLKDSFDTFLPNIIRLTAILDGVDDLSYENFYFQKGKMIPASAIVDCILDGITGASKAVFTSSYEMYPGGSHFTYQHPFEDDYGAYADETTIAWDVTISFSSVLHSIGL